MKIKIKVQAELLRVAKDYYNPMDHRERVAGVHISKHGDVVSSNGISLFIGKMPESDLPPFSDGLPLTLHIPFEIPSGCEYVVITVNPEHSQTVHMSMLPENSIGIAYVRSGLYPDWSDALKQEGLITLKTASNYKTYLFPIPEISGTPLEVLER